MHVRWVSVAIACSILASGSCGSPPAPSRPAPPPPPATPAKPPAPRPTPALTGTATIRDLAGAQVGSATFADTHAGVLISGTVSGLGLGPHAMHIHEVGKCQPPFATARGHANPGAKLHGYRNPMGTHLGDLPNIELPAAGTLHFEFVIAGATLKGGGPNALLGTDGASLIIHSARDDYVTDPSGNSGSRLACGVIIIN